MATRPDAGMRRDLNGAQLAAVVGGLLLVLFVLWFLLLRGGEPEPATPAPASLTNTTTTPEAAATPEPQEPNESPVETFEVFAPKDPFKPLVETGGAGGAAGPTGTASPTTTGGTTATGGTTTTTTFEGNGGGGGGGGSSRGAKSIEGHSVKLIDVFETKRGRRAQVQVDGTVYTVDEDETFAETFKLLSASGECASMLYGDDQFSICEGEEILK